MKKTDFPFLAKTSKHLLFLVFSILVIVGISTSCANTQEPFSTIIAKDDVERNIAKLPKSEYFYAQKYKKERNLYLKALDAYETKDYALVKELKGRLTNYPLAVYLDFLLLQTGNYSVKEVKDFIEHSGHKSLANRLKSIMIVIYASRGQYNNLFAIAPNEPNSDYLKCHWQRARYHSGYRKESRAFIINKYRSGGILNKGCLDFVNDLKKAKKITSDDTFTRLSHVYWTRYGEQVYRTAARELKRSGYRTAVNMLDKYYNNSKLYSKVPAKFSTTAALIFKRYARQYPLKAYKEYPSFKKRYKVSSTQQNEIEKILVSNFLFERYNVPLKFVDERLDKYKDSELYERRIRLAIFQKDNLAIVKYIKKLPENIQNKENYRYWLARGYESTAQKEKAKKLYTDLAKERCFYCYLAADKVHMPYHIAPVKVDVNVPRENLLKKYKAYERFAEVELLSDAKGLKTEWFELMREASLEDARIIAQIESDRGFEDLAIWETIVKQDWDNLSVRFPILFEDIYSEHSKAQNVSISYLLGITRQESIMNPVAVSPVGARGLMQIMPGTAKDISRRNSYDYKGVSTLFNPKVNIMFGATYLRELLEEFNGNRIYATAGYNAGPARAYKWQSKDGIKRDMVTYIETIPFSETRNYVQRVLFYDFIYQNLLHKKQTVFLTDKEKQAFY